MFLEQQIIILQWFVTLKTGVMMLKIQLCHFRNKLHFKIKKKKLLLNRHVYGQIIKILSKIYIYVRYITFKTNNYFYNLHLFYSYIFCGPCDAYNTVSGVPRLSPGSWTFLYSIPPTLLPVYLLSHCNKRQNGKKKKSEDPQASPVQTVERRSWRNVMAELIVHRVQFC